MSRSVDPGTVFHRRRGAVCEISSGDLPEFPAWFEEEIARIIQRLREEAEAVRSQARQCSGCQ